MITEIILLLPGLFAFAFMVVIAGIIAVIVL